MSQVPGALQTQKRSPSNLTLPMNPTIQNYATEAAAGPPTVVLKKTLINYAALGNGIIDIPSSVTIKDGSGNIVSVTSYNYDETAVVANTAATQQHVAITGSRGNLASIPLSCRATDGTFHLLRYRNR
jgi:hypothetical protein